MLAHPSYASLPSTRPSSHSGEVFPATRRFSCRIHSNDATLRLTYFVSSRSYARARLDGHSLGVRMRAFFGTIFAAFICACAAQAQDPTSLTTSANSVATSTFSFSTSPSTSFFPLPLTADSSSSTPAPEPFPRIHGHAFARNSIQIGVGFEYVLFRSGPFNANLGGLHPSFTYSRNDWLGFEGNVVAAFGSSTLNSEASKLALFTAGPRIVWRRERWQPWAHALVGGMRVFPQTAFSNGGFAAQLGGGADWPLTPIVSLRVESDYLRSQLFPPARTVSSSAPALFFVSNKLLKPPFSFFYFPFSGFTSTTTPIFSSAFKYSTTISNGTGPYSAETASRISCAFLLPFAKFGTRLQTLPKSPRSISILSDLPLRNCISKAPDAASLAFQQSSAAICPRKPFSSPSNQV